MLVLSRNTGQVIADAGGTSPRVADSEYNGLCRLLERTPKIAVTNPALWSDCRRGKGRSAATGRGVAGASSVGRIREAPSAVLLGSHQRC